MEVTPVLYLATRDPHPLRDGLFFFRGNCVHLFFSATLGASDPFVNRPTKPTRRRLELLKNDTQFTYCITIK